MPLFFGGDAMAEILSSYQLFQLRMRINDRDKTLFSDDEIKLVAINHATDSSGNAITVPDGNYATTSEVITAVEAALSESPTVDLDLTEADLLEIILTDPNKWSNFQAVGVTADRNIDITRYINNRIKTLRNTIKGAELL